MTPSGTLACSWWSYLWVPIASNNIHVKLHFMADKKLFFHHVTVFKPFVCSLLLLVILNPVGESFKTYFQFRIFFYSSDKKIRSIIQYWRIGLSKYRIRSLIVICSNLISIPKLLSLSQTPIINSSTSQLLFLLLDMNIFLMSIMCFS